MKKSLLSILTLALVAVGCQNYDDQFDSLNANIAALTTKVNGLDAGVAAQVTAVSASVANLSTQVTALGASALTTTDLTTALSGVLTNIATVSAAVTALDSSVATSIAGVNTNVAALTTQLTAVQTSALSSADVAALTEVTNLNAEIVQIIASLDELLAAQASVNGNVSITNQAELDYVETLIETDGTPANYIINGNLIITATAASFDTGYIAAISALTGKMASVIGTVTITTAATDAALDISQLTYVSGALAIVGKMPSGFTVSTAASLALTVHEADITLASLTSAAGGVVITPSATVTTTNLAIANLTNGAVTTGTDALVLALADVNLGAGHPAKTTTVKSLIAGNATTSLVSTTILASGAVTLGTKVVSGTVIDAGGAVTLSSGVAGSSVSSLTINSGGDVSIAALTIGGGLNTVVCDGGSGSITFGATSTGGALTATASGSTINASSLANIAAGATALTGTSVDLTGLVSNTGGLTVRTATSLNLPAMVSSAGTITGPAVVTFSAPSLITDGIINNAAGTYVVKSLTVKEDIADLTTMTALTVNDQVANLVLSSAAKMTTLNYTGKAAASNSGQANDLTISAMASLTTVNLSGSSDVVIALANPLMTTMTTSGYIRSFTVTGVPLTSLTFGHVGLNGGTASTLSITDTRIISLDLSGVKWIGTMVISDNTSLTTVAMPTDITAANNANPSLATGTVSLSITSNALTGVWTDAVPASGSNLYAEGSLAGSGLTGAKTWLEALQARVVLAVASVTYDIEIDAAKVKMEADICDSVAIGATSNIDNEGGAAELAILPN